MRIKRVLLLAVFLLHVPKPFCSSKLPGRWRLPRQFWDRLLVASCCIQVCHAHSPADLSAKCTDAITQWQSLKYGMFIHFGMSTFTGDEIDLGDKPSTTYAPTNLDVDQWVRVARDAGMKYVVLTSKHVSGHCLWDSKVMWKGQEFEYDVATSNDKTDVVEKFMAACKKYGLQPGLYYCLLDPRHNSVPMPEQWNAGRLPEDFFELAKGQLGELIKRHPELGYLWLDIPRAASLEQRSVLYTHIKKLSPDCIVLFNHGTAAPKGPATIATIQVAWPTDILNTERDPLQVGQFTPRQIWQEKDYCLGYEHCDTICKNWFWEPNDLPRPTADLHRLYKQVADAGGNFLLNVPPDRTGQIPDCHVRALMKLKKAFVNPSVLPSDRVE